MTPPIAPQPPVITSPVVTPPPAPKTDLGLLAKGMAIDTVIAAGVPATLMAFPQVVNSLFGDTPEWAARADQTTLGVAVLNGVVQVVATAVCMAGTYSHTKFGPTQNVLTGASLMTLALGIVTAATYGDQNMGMVFAASALTTGATLLQRLGYNLAKSRES